jgi:hypothetical protein
LQLWVRGSAEGQYIANRKLTFPSSLQLIVIVIDQEEEKWGDPRSSGRRDLPRNSSPVTSKIAR